MQKSLNQLLLFYFLLIGLLALYSFALTDPNITLFNSPFWTDFRNIMVHFGYYERQKSLITFFSLLFALFGFHVYFMRHAKKLNALHIALGTAFLLLFSYPFLSHDLFNYMFDARILTTYGANPYLHKALDFPNDPWLRFMHWTHRTYPYGPTFLPLTLIPSILSFGKFALNFVLFKSLFAFAYVSTVYILYKRNKDWAIFFATNPLVLIEGLINAHNDLIAVWLGMLGVLMLKSRFKSLVLLGLSAGVKYITAPLLALLLPMKNHHRRFIAFSGIAAPILYISLTGEPQPWYYLNFLVFIPYFYDELKDTYIFSFGLLFSYYPFIALGDWGMPGNTELKHSIMLAFVLLQIAYFLFKKKFSSTWSFVRKGA